ncbi:unnamed protein product [Tetraodon nigroviridis]|uniref:Cadherin-13 n=1 Tax=Tetraodon nigroviridis TaxID=99883 RepID=Q4SKE5_TETNG|nr:unnamed protein product [Tetraodon nigroviridis]
MKKKMVEFDDCTGNEDVRFEVSDPSFQVDENLNLVLLQDVLNTSPGLFIRGFGAHADDVAQVKIMGAAVQPPHTLKDILGLDHTASSRFKRSLLVPPMIVTENQRAPFPRIIGRVISAEKSRSHIFRLTGPGADQDPKGLFIIDMETGDVLVSRSLDREAIESYQVCVCLCYILMCLPGSYSSFNQICSISLFFRIEKNTLLLFQIAAFYQKK